MKKTSPIHYSTYHSPVGLLMLRASQKGLGSIHYMTNDSEHLENNNDHINQCKKQLDEYFSGSRRKFNLSLDIQGTTFQVNLWIELLSVSYGERISYKSLAERLNNKHAARAVGNACNKNPISIIIPCHRIVGSDQSLKGYAGGLVNKKWLLQHEQQNIYA